MSRRFWLGTLLLAVGVVSAVLAAEDLAGGASRRAAVTADGRPNIVFILTDDLTWDLVPYMPQVRRMQREGMTFRQFVVADSLCCSSRATIFTGQFPHDTRVLGNTAPLGGYRAFRNNGAQQRSVAISLQRAGYRTALFGKYLNEYDPYRNGIEPGWDEWFAMGWGYGGFGYSVSDDGVPLVMGYRARDYTTDVLARRASGFIRHAPAGQPFFAMISTFAPHEPSTPAPRDRSLFRRLPLPEDRAFDTQTVNPPTWLGQRAPLNDRQRRIMKRLFRMRARSVQAIDDLIKRVRTTLRRTGAARNTYVVFTSDNGYHLGQHRLTAGKRTAYDEDVRVPLVVVGPDVAPGSATSEIAGSVDLAPTFERWAGAPIDWSRDGTSLTPLPRGRTPRNWPPAQLIEHTYDLVAPGDPDAQGWARGKPASYTALRTRWTTYVEYEKGDREFYDRRIDPGETHNLAGHMDPAILARYSQALQRYRQCHGVTQCLDAARSVP